MTRPLVPLVLVFAALLLIVSGIRGWLLNGNVVDEPVPVVIETGAAYESRVRAMQDEMNEVIIERNGLRGALQKAENRIRGLEARRPERIVVFDTIIDIRRDTVIQALRIAGGRATIDVALPDSGGHRPATLERVQVGDCDDGLTISGTHVVCNRARLGHAELFGAVGGVAELGGAFAPIPRAVAGVLLRPSYRSTSAIELGIDSDRRIFAQARVGLRLW